MNSSALIQKFKDAGQGHVFRFYPKLGEAEKSVLLKQAAEINLAEISFLSKEWQEIGSSVEDFSGLAPAPYVQHPTSGGNQELWTVASALGEEALRKGRVAAFTVAGGQGTRLGYDGPKGTFPSTPVKGKPLFQLFAEKIRASGDRYGQAIEWLIMTSIQNDADTRAFFEEHDFFGLDRLLVHFFTQGLMPAVDISGKILMADRGLIAMSPDGHGGSLRALVRSGNIERLRARGVDTISYFQVDNPLVQCIDPAFIGFHLKECAEISSKMVQKAYAGEKVGHFCVRDHRQVVIEYSDLPMALQEERILSTGELRYLAGSIAIHILDLEFVARVGGGDDPALTLPFHFAHKKVSCIDVMGGPVNPMEPNGIKFEMFIFDSLPLAKRSVIIETRREDEFSPIKNASGKDSPKTSKLDQSAQFLRWIEAAGEDVNMLESIEISPLCAQTESEFLNYWKALQPKPELKDGIYLNLKNNF
jgi:UDP-N-acetylglucosamine/UDP-N-acetylgalactosamine diphosphorylase